MTEHDPLAGAALRHPFPEPPAPGQALEVAPGLLWLRLALPLALNHVNVFALDDGDGWLIWDAGLGDQPSLDAWEALLSGPLAGRPVRRVLITHHHPDHVGAAGWLCRRTGAELLMPKTEYLLARLRIAALFEETAEEDQAFFLSRGLSREAMAGILGRGPEYVRTVHRLPASYQAIADGETIRIGGRDWRLRTGGGHSDEMAMLWQPEAGLFLAADQVMVGITPNVGVWPSEPDSRPLDQFLASIRALAAEIPDDALVLPGHKLPFTGLAQRVDELIAHHDKVFGKILSACAEGPLTVGELIPKLFKRELPPHHAGLAFAESLAHANSLIGRGRLRMEQGADGLLRLAA